MVIEPLEDEEEERLPWCLRGYPFKCPFEEITQFIDVDNPDPISALNELCRNCPKRIEYISLMFQLGSKVENIFDVPIYVGGGGWGKRRLCKNIFGCLKSVIEGLQALDTSI